MRAITFQNATQKMSAVAIFVISCLYFSFSLHYIDIDKSELSPAKERAQAETEIAKFCSNNINLYGIRLACRKFMTSDIVRSVDKNIILTDVISALESVLKISPMEPAYWLELTNQKLNLLTDIDKVVASLRMSYLTGRSVQQLAVRRFTTAVAIWEALDPADKSVALNDLKIVRPEHVGDLISVVAGRSQQTVSDIIMRLRIKDSALASKLQSEARQSIK